ncbi:hypothetical protein [Corynebacterium meridianum]|uniref:Uncharacterized protein n=1 Tax=Corynebacterium meridianum TaxID=2765363 RepID=A0A934I0Y6_9CORY|nr:hypothetical protein [Corynebacterium meridianum]MBI8989260.1 hypothetical protein [Corynebacterium meridianum]MCK7676894.1 hypothetical protein [Corynebacterium meridianum]
MIRKTVEMGFYRDRQSDTDVPTTPRSNRKAVFSWIAVGLGVCGLLSSFGDSGVVHIMSSIIFSVGIALPGAM